MDCGGGETEFLIICVVCQKVSGPGMGMNQINLLSQVIVIVVKMVGLPD